MVPLILFATDSAHAFDMSSTGNNAIIIDPGVNESKEVKSDDAASDDEQQSGQGMTIQPTKFLFFRLNDDFELKVSVPMFILIIFVLTIITMISNIFAVFTIPLFFAVVFAAVSEKIDYRYDNLFLSEEE